MTAKTFLDWRRPKALSSQTTSHIHNHTTVDLSDLERRIAHLEERLSMGASMKDVQLIAQATAGVEDALQQLRDQLNYLERNALTDVALKKVVQQ